MFPEDQIAELKLLCPEIYIEEEGGKIYLLLKDLPLPDGSSPEKVDALLCTSLSDGYPSRLFFAERVKHPHLDNLNWNVNGTRILEKNWHAYSWKINRNGLSLAQIVSAHLSAK